LGPQNLERIEDHTVAVTARRRNYIKLPAPQKGQLYLNTSFPLKTFWRSTPQAPTDRALQTLHLSNIAVVKHEVIEPSQNGHTNWVFAQPVLR
jgi:hypothetical protein